MSHLLIVCSCTLIAALIFRWFPGIDLQVSQYFFTPGIGFCNTACRLEGGEFLFVFWDYFASPVFPVIFLSILVISIIRQYTRTKSLCYQAYIPALYMLLCMLLGPLIIVKSAKEIFSRARPEQIIEFGGELSFTNVFVVDNQCKKSCSFPSGHAGFIFMLFSPAFLIQEKRRRQRAVIGVALLGLFFGWGRVVIGSHFISDIVFSGFFVYIASYTLALLFKLESVKSTGRV